MTTEIYLRDRSSGRIHAAVRRGNRILTDEGDNLDDSGAHEEITADEFASLDPDALCRNCFPDHVTVTNEGA